MHFKLLLTSLMMLNGCVSLSCATPNTDEAVDPIPQWEHHDSFVSYTPPPSNDGPEIVSSGNKLCQSLNVVAGESVAATLRR